MLPLPSQLRLAELPESHSPRLGLRESGDPWLLPHQLLVIGAPGSGRSNLVVTAIAELARTSTPQRRQLLLLSGQAGSLAAACPDDWLLAHAHDLAGATQATKALAEVLASRLASPADPPAGPPGMAPTEVWVIADDTEHLRPGQLRPDPNRADQFRAGQSWAGQLPAGPPGQAIWAPLIPLLPKADQIGLRLLVTVRAHGVARTLHEPLMDHLRLRGEVALLSGPAEEGPIAHGQRMRPLPSGRAVVLNSRGAGELAQVARADLAPD